MYLGGLQNYVAIYVSLKIASAMTSVNYLTLHNLAQREWRLSIPFSRSFRERFGRQAPFWTSFSVSSVDVLHMLCFFFFFKIFIYLFLKRGEGREKDRERNIDVREKHGLSASHMRPQLGTEPTAQADALTGNLTSDLLLCGTMPDQLSQAGQGCSFLKWWCSLCLLCPRLIFFFILSCVCVQITSLESVFQLPSICCELPSLSLQYVSLF